MDIYTITERLGKDPTDRNARRNTIHLLRKHGITPLRRGLYGEDDAEEFIHRYVEHVQKYPNRFNRKKIMPS